MVEITQLASQAIVRGVRESGGSTDAVVAQLRRASVEAYERIGRDEAIAVMILANAVEIDAELAAARR